MKIDWTELPPLPPLSPNSVQPGVAGPFAGLHGNTLIVAGGANFPDIMPWDGGKKQYHSAIYALRLHPDGKLYSTVSTGMELPAQVAYGASASVGAGVVCMGGETEKGLTDQVYIISLAGNQTLITPLPALPVPLSNASSVSIGSVAYIAGGVTPDGASKALWCLDTEDVASGWKRLADIPLPLINSVMTTTEGRRPALWLLGGRTRWNDDDVSVIRSEIYRYSVTEDKWHYEGILSCDGDTIKLAAGTGATVDGRYIALFGGNDGSVFNRVEKILSGMVRETDTTAIREMKLQYISLQENHPGFARDVIVFDTETKKCFRAGEIPGPAQVTTTAVTTPDGIIIPSGEIRPGIRTPIIREARFR